MFIYNLKLNSSILFKILIGFIIFTTICMCIFIGFKIFKESNNSNTCVSSLEIIKPTNKTYSSILQTIHNNVDLYIGKKIKYSGFIYRVYDLNIEQFILGRNMIISSDFQTVVIGFLSHYKDAINFQDGIWVEIEGAITKGNYNGYDMPILEITNIKEIEKPNDEYVYPPDKNYISISKCKTTALQKNVFFEGSAYNTMV